jgi:lipopolysaccharide/colanic/teichoic acid biosynthesis glycosyltransferase
VHRFFDVFFSACALLVLSPLLVPVALLLRFTGEGEVFYFQERIGRNQVPFRLYKFATMLKDSPNMGTGTITVREDPRVLPVGRLLRTTKINELPQLLNILFGDMSVVGPRPLTRQTFGAYSAETQDTVARVRPGLSGVGSIVFRREEDILAGEAGSRSFYNNVIAPYKGELEKWYVAHQGLGTYFTVILVTVWVVLAPQSQVAWKAFPGLPPPPEELKRPLNYPA